VGQAVLVMWPPTAAAQAAASGAARVQGLLTGNPVAVAAAAIASGTGRFLAEAVEAAVVVAVPLAVPAAVEGRRAPAVRAVLPAQVVAAAAVAADEGSRR
jgi:hypothetical protein